MVRIQKTGPLYQLCFMPAFFPVNCYIVEEKQSLTLVDTGLSFSVKAIMGMVRQLEKPIQHIVLTHAHEGHVGAVDALKHILPDVPVCLSAREARLLEGDRSLDETEPQKPWKGGVPKRMSTRPDRLLHSGDRIGSLEAVFTPGHTPGSMSFFDCRTKQLIAGDAFQTKGGTAVSGVLKPLFPFPALATWDVPSAVESAKKIQLLEPALLAAGHGDMIQEPGAAILQAIGEAERALDRKR